MHSVGASQSDGDDLARGQRGKDYLVFYSMNGPTIDGRTKPDVVAPGSWILSAGSQPETQIECDAFPMPLPGQGGGLQGVAYREGTSMSAAVAAGSAALVRQYFEEGMWPSGIRNPFNRVSPSGALVKAILMNGAQYLIGVDNNFAGVSRLAPYDSSQNFGRINLRNSLYLINENNVRTAMWDYQTIGDQVSRTYDLKYTPQDKCLSKDISITLVWMDPPAAVGCKSCLLNDLDLSAIRNKNPNFIYYPNDLPSPEIMNNAERIKIQGMTKKDNKIKDEQAILAVMAFQCIGE